MSASHAASSTELRAEISVPKEKARADPPVFFAQPPPWWPDGMPFHEGEVAMQKAVGGHDRVMSYAPRFIRPYLPDQHREFYRNQPLLAVAARDAVGAMWSTMIFNSNNIGGGGGDDDVLSVAESPDPATLRLIGSPAAGDALEGALKPGADVGILGIEFATKRRNRVNGRIVQGDGSDSPLVFRVGQSFGNCPQYIKPRRWWRAAPEKKRKPDRPSTRATALSPDQMRAIRSADTVFVATGYRPSSNGDGVGVDDARYGNDSSHRGGPAGFVEVVDSTTLLMPEYAGNGHYNSLGNLLMDGRMGVTVPDFEGGGLLQLSGTGEVVCAGADRGSGEGSARHYIKFRIEQVNELPRGAMPIRFSVGAEGSSKGPRPLAVSDIVVETDDVKSFYLKAAPTEMEKEPKPLDGYRAGQHLPLRLKTQSGEVMLRTYSLSESASAATASSSLSGRPDYYRISVKRQGRASSYLHDEVRVGDVVHADPPAGGFVLNPPRELRGSGIAAIATATAPPIVLLSAGIGVTPVYAMLQELLHGGGGGGGSPPQQQLQPRIVAWIHVARDESHHALADQVEKTVEEAMKKPGRFDVRVRVAYTRSSTTSQDIEGAGEESSPRPRQRRRRLGHGGADLANLVRSAFISDGEGERAPSSLFEEAEFYACGPASFLADVHGQMAEELGVDDDKIRSESF